MMNQRDIIDRIINERKRQDILHPNNKNADYLAILIEEVGEVGKALQGDGNMIDEIIQIAAVCVRWLEEQ
jgi:NTP pyrophosphatase (non-canonical NTP hydrolase)